MKLSKLSIYHVHECLSTVECYDANELKTCLMAYVSDSSHFCSFSLAHSFDKWKKKKYSKRRIMLCMYSDCLLSNFIQFTRYQRLFEQKKFLVRMAEIQHWTKSIYVKIACYVIRCIYGRKRVSKTIRSLAHKSNRILFFCFFIRWKNESATRKKKWLLQLASNDIDDIPK